MPRYFFHLSFGDRLLPDEEGVELASRSAARQEALAVVRDLSGSVSRWASWFLRVVDQQGQFLQLPIGQPALELVSNDAPDRRSASTRRTPAGQAVAAMPVDARSERATALFEEALALRKRTAQLLERNRELRSELQSALRSNEAAWARACQLTSHARLRTAAEPDIYRIAARPARHSPPRLVLLPGGGGG